jgi:hypothetical protein
VIRTADSVGVGTPGRALRRPGARVLAGEGAMFVTLPTHCGLSFRLRGVRFGRLSSPAQIPDTAGVDEVLAIGCGPKSTSSPTKVSRTYGMVRRVTWRMQRDYHDGIGRSG